MASAITESENAGCGLDLKSKIAWYARRLDICVQAFSQSLMLEFYPQRSRVIADWRENLAWLRECTYPLRGFLLSLEVEDAERPYHMCALSRWRTLDHLFLEAEKELAKIPAEDSNYFSTLYTANLSIRRGIKLLETWVSEFDGIEAQASEPAAFRPTAEVVECVWIKNMQLLGVLVEAEAYKRELTKTDREDARQVAERTFDQCMQSRKSYLASIYLAMLYPDKWTIARYKELKDLQKALQSNMNEGSPYRVSVVNRLEMIEHADPLLLGRQP